MRLASVLLLAFAAAARGEDVAAPVIQHTPVTSLEPGAKWLQVFARITDQSKFYPQVFFRSGGGEYQKPIDMKQVKGQKGLFGANIPVQGEGVEYYLEAYDEFGNGPGRAGGPDKPFRVGTAGSVAQVQPAPKPVEAPAPSEPIAEPTRRSPVETKAAAPAQGGRVWTWIAGGTGLGLLAGGVLTGLAYKSADDAYQKRLADPSQGGESLKAQADANKSLKTKGAILLISGGVLLAGSVALWFLEGPKGSQGEGKNGLSGGVAPTDGGAAVALAGNF